MRRRAMASVIATQLAFQAILPSVAQQASEPPTLENLVSPQEVQTPPAATPPDAADNGPKPPVGTLVRPKECVQHEALNKAWDDYQIAVGKASQMINAAIAKQLDTATQKGNLEAAEKWQAISDRFTNGIALPDEDETRAAVTNAVIELTKAKDRLSKTYDAVVKVFTKEKKVAEARKARDEIANVTRAADKSTAKAGVAEPHKARSRVKKVVFLSDLDEQDVVVGWGHFGKDGWLGYSELDGRVRVNGTLFRKALSMHGVSNGVSKVSYDVPDGCSHFDAVAAISDTVDGRQKTPLTLKLLGDKGVLWTSKPLFGGGAAERCNVDLKGSKRITLVVACPGDNGWSQAVWCDPHFVAD